jgi:hypothetical protein
MNPRRKVQEKTVEVTISDQKSQVKVVAIVEADQ